MGLNFRKYICIISLICVLLNGGEKIVRNTEFLPAATDTGVYIKWIDFDVPYSAMIDAMKLDISSYGSEHHYAMSDILALLASGNGGDFSGYKSADTEALKKQLDGKRDISGLVKNQKLYTRSVRCGSRRCHGTLYSG